jgi:hypothetical protein
VSATAAIHDDAFLECDALQELAAPWNMDVNTYVVRGPRAVFYHFLLCNKVRSLMEEDVTKVLADFLFDVPIPPPVADDYVPSTAAEVEERLQAQLALQRLYEQKQQLQEQNQQLQQQQEGDDSEEGDDNASDNDDEEGGSDENDGDSEENEDEDDRGEAERVKDIVDNMLI